MNENIRPSKKIIVPYNQIVQYRKDAKKIAYKCPRWPTMTEINTKILPNLDAMLPFLMWVNETAPKPTTQEEKMAKAALIEIMKGNFKYEKTVGEPKKSLPRITPIEMTWEKYEEMFLAAENSTKGIKKWPTMEEIKKRDPSKFKEMLPWYIEVLESTPTPSTEEEKECWRYINDLIRTNVHFIEEEE